MKAACPRCGRGTQVDEDAGDFPTRCTRCGALVRRRSETPAAEAVAVGARIERGVLAGLLISRSVETPAIIHAHGPVAAAAAPHRSVLRPESRQAISRARARQKALARAKLKVNEQALGTLTWAGLVLVLLLGLSAVALKAHAMWRHPAPARADTLRVD